MFELKYIHPDSLHTHWEQVRPGLVKVKEHSGDTWLPEDVYMAIKSGKSTLHIGSLNEKYAGFIVLTPSSSYDGAVLHIWATYSEAKDFCVFTHGIEQLKQFATNLNAKRITFLSPRKGWERHGAKLGFMPRTVQYALEV